MPIVQLVRRTRRGSPPRQWMIITRQEAQNSVSSVYRMGAAMFGTPVPRFIAPSVLGRPQ